MFTPDHIVKSGLPGSSIVKHTQKAMWVLASRLYSSSAACQLCRLKRCPYLLCPVFSSLKQNFNSSGLRTDVMLYMKPLVEFLAWNKHSTVIIMIIVMILRILGFSLPHSALTVLLAHLTSNCPRKIFIPFVSIMLANDFSFCLVRSVPQSADTRTGLLEHFLSKRSRL